MKYLLDTCCISDFVRGDKNTLYQIKNNNPSDLSVSSITVLELEYGLQLDFQRAKKIKSVIHSLIHSMTILPFTEQDALCAASIRAQLKKAGTPIGAYDVLIAGSALYHQLILVTSNEKEFKRLSELQMVNWRVH